MSILLTVIRICPLGPRRTALIYFAIAYGLVFFILFAQLFWVCERQPLWKDAVIPQCVLGREVAIAQVISMSYTTSSFHYRRLILFVTNSGYRQRHCDAGHSVEFDMETSRWLTECPKIPAHSSFPDDICDDGHIPLPLLRSSPTRRHTRNICRCH